MLPDNGDSIEIYFGLENNTLASVPNYASFQLDPRLALGAPDNTNLSSDIGVIFADNYLTLLIPNGTWPDLGTTSSSVTNGVLHGDSALAKQIFDAQGELLCEGDAARTQVRSMLLSRH